MRKFFITYTTILIISSKISIFSQTAPAAPIIKKISIDPITGCDTIIWYRSSSPNADYYVIGVADISNPYDPIHLDSIGYVNAPDSIFVNCNSQSSKKVVGYSIVAYKKVTNGVLPSGFNVPDSTIFLTAEFDSCNLVINLEWNKYNKWKNNILYHIVNIVKNGKIISIDTLTENNLTYSYNKINEKDTITFFITTVNNTGLISNSNPITVCSNLKKRPEYISADYANRNNNKYTLHFTIDPSTEIETYELINSLQPEGVFKIIKEINTKNKEIELEVEVEEPNNINYFKLIALNECNSSIKVSNTISNVLINVKNNNLTNIISWNEIYKWMGDIDYYMLYRIIGNNEYIDSFKTFTNEYVDNISGVVEILKNISEPTICYQVRTIQKNHPYGLNYSTVSDVKCIAIYPEAQIPNAFTPENPSGKNSVFRPLFNYEPEKYILSIYTRWGNLVWQGSGPWDGKLNGSYVPEGVYIYNLKVYFKGKIIKEYTGTVTVIR